MTELVKLQLTVLSHCKFKNENSENDAVTDNVAGQAYVEQFGLEVFGRADNAVRANKASK
jgi:vacuolar protein sorting-associated protein VTA1